LSFRVDPGRVGRRLRRPERRRAEER